MIEAAFRWLISIKVVAEIRHTALPLQSSGVFSLLVHYLICKKTDSCPPGKRMEMEEDKMGRRLFSTGLSIICILAAAIVSQAQKQQSYRGTYQSVRQLISSIENRSTNFMNA